MIHELPLEQRTLHGHFSRDLEPVLVIEPGDSVRIAVPNAGWFLDSGEQFVSRARRSTRDTAGAHRSAWRAYRRDAGVRSTRYNLGPGMDRLRSRTAARTLDGGVGRTGERRQARAVPGRTRDAAARDRPALTTPRRSGGNIDPRSCRRLEANAPIPTDGALFSAGDGHAAQGDGEVSGTAIDARRVRS